MTHFDQFVLSRGPALLRLGYLLSGDRTLAEDLVQEALVKAHRHWGRVVAAQYPEAYVRQMLVNELTSWRRRRRNTETPGLPAAPDDGVDDGADQRARRDLMWRCLAGLPARQRAAVVLRYYEDLPEGEIAVALGCAPATVRSLISRALQGLRDHPQLIEELAGEGR